jgi:hypothetical protein
LNFLSHYFASSEYSENVRIATLLPDIFPKFSYLHNVYFKHYDTSKLNALELEFWRGIEVHYADDARFHSMASFQQFTKVIDDELKNDVVLAGIKRKFLIGHILYELLIDHWVISKQPEITTKIYQQFEALPPDSIQNFLTKIIADSKKIELLLQAFERFQERRFLAFYADETNLVKALHRVTGKISAWEYNENTEKSFINVIRETKTKIQYRTLFEYVSKNRKLV